MKTPIDVVKGAVVPEEPVDKRTIIVKPDAKVDTVEKYFKQLEFKHQVRLATMCLIGKCIENGHDSVIKVQVPAGENTCSFTISISLDEKK